LLRSSESQSLRLEYQQLTNFANSATSPAISPDGRMLTFILGESTFFGPGEIYVKALPDGEPVQLTNDGLGKMGPKFTPDGVNITYSSFGTSPDIRIVPVLGGKPRRIMENVGSVTWIPDDPQPRMLFSEFTGRGHQLAIVTSLEQRREQRTVYMPREEGMAHRAYLSPDRKNVLVVEMDLGVWLPCRLVPFDASSQGKQVGPAPAQCTDAAWTPDGKWMYFAANTGSGSHIWRQRFPDGQPEQVTFGATEEDGIEFAPDGKSFVTSIGNSQSTLWVHDAKGDRQITSEGWAVLPAFSPDGKKLYYLMHSGARTVVNGELWVTDLETGQRQRLLRDFMLRHYSISPDAERVVFCAADSSGEVSVWLARLDGRVAPRQLARADAYTAFFTRNGDIVFLGGTIVYRIKQDGSGLQRILSASTPFLENVSPDGKWVVAWGSSKAQMNVLLAYPISGGAPMVVCDQCLEAGGKASSFERGPKPQVVSWSRDGSLLYFWLEGGTYAVPLRAGEVWPQLPAKAIQSKADIARLPGARLVGDAAFIGPDPGVYAFTKFATQRNIYRVFVEPGSKR
jgi:Tol biopolymer transport system component